MHICKQPVQGALKWISLVWILLRNVLLINWRVSLPLKPNINKYCLRKRALCKPFSGLMQIDEDSLVSMLLSSNFHISYTAIRCKKKKQIASTAWYHMHHKNNSTNKLLTVLFRSFIKHIIIYYCNKPQLKHQLWAFQLCNIGITYTQ